MKNKALIVYGLLLAVLVGAFWGTQKGKSSRRGKDNSLGTLLFPQDHSNLASMTLTNQGFKPFTLVQKKGEWFLKKGGYKTDKKELKSFLDAYEATRFTSTFDMKDAKAQKLYGLENPTELFEFQYQDGEKFKFWVGGKSPVPGNNYIRVNDEKTARVILEQDLLFLKKTVHQLRDKTIVEIDPKSVVSFSISAKPGAKKVYKKSDKQGVGWLDTKNLPLMSTEVDTILEAFNPLEAMSFAPSSTKRPNHFGAYTLHTQDKKSSTIYIWRDGEKNLAQVKGKKDVYHLPDELLGTALTKPILETRAFPWYADQLETIDLVTPSGKLTAILNQENQKWSCKGDGLKSGCGEELRLVMEAFSSATSFGLKKVSRPSFEDRSYSFVFTFKKEGDTNPKQVNYQLGFDGNTLLGYQDHHGLEFKLESYMANRLRIFQKESFEKAKI